MPIPSQMIYVAYSVRSSCFSYMSLFMGDWDLYWNCIYECIIFFKEPVSLLFSDSILYTYFLLISAHSFFLLSLAWICSAFSDFFRWMFWLFSDMRHFIILVYLFWLKISYEHQVHPHFYTLYFHDSVKNVFYYPFSFFVWSVD